MLGLLSHSLLTQGVNVLRLVTPSPPPPHTGAALWLSAQLIFLSFFGIYRLATRILVFQSLLFILCVSHKRKNTKTDDGLSLAYIHS
jgi:hypothetical protein